LTAQKKIFIDGKKYLLYRAYKHKKNALIQMEAFKKKLIKYRLVEKKDKRPYKLYYRDVIDK